MKKKFDNGVQLPVMREMVEVYVITTPFGDSKNYVTALEKRKGFDNKYLPSFTTEANNAMEFDWYAEASEKIPFIVNHLERVFTVEKIQVERPVEV